MAESLSPIDESIIPELVDAGLVTSHKYLPLRDVFRNSQFWTEWALKALFALAVGHILAGIVFFFAHNWFELPDLMKFAIVGSGIVLSVLAWLGLKLDSRVGQAFGISATVLVGVMFAVFGQVYQTPALIHTPFVMWAFLTLPFAAVSKNLAHWAVWLAIAVVAVFAYASTGIRIKGNDLGANAFIIGAGLMGFLVLTLYDYFLAGRRAWTKQTWFRVLLITIISLFFVVGFTPSFWDKGDSWQGLLALSTILFVCVVIAYLYRFKPTLAGLSLATFAFFIIAIQILFRIIDGFGDAGSFLLIFLGLIGLIIAMAKAFTHFAKISPKSELKADLRHQAKENGDVVGPSDIAKALEVETSKIIEVTESRNKNVSPWYIETFMAIAGVFAAIFGCAFIGSFLGLLISGSENFGIPLLIVGLFLFGGSTYLRMKTGLGFTRHFLNTLILVGSVTAIIGLGIITEEFEAGILFTIVLASLTLFLVKDPIIEFLSALTIAGCIGFELYYRFETMMPETLFLIFATGLGVLFLIRPIRRRVYNAAGAALLIAPALLGVFLVHVNRFDRIVNENVLHPLSWQPRVLSLLVLALAVIWVNKLNKERRGWRPPLSLLIPLIIAMALLPFGGASALLLVLLGYILGARSLAVVGVLLQIYFLYMFYYDLALSLGVKSYLLMVTGVVFLGTWYFAEHLRGREVTS